MAIKKIFPRINPNDLGNKELLAKRLFLLKLMEILTGKKIFDVAVVTTD